MVFVLSCAPVSKKRLTYILLFFQHFFNNPGNFFQYLRLCGATAVAPPMALSARPPPLPPIRAV
jgi:hypothetical protein